MSPLQNAFADLALDATLQGRYGGGKRSVTATYTTAGDHVLVDPAPGNRVKLFWINAIDNSGGASGPVVTVKLASDTDPLRELYRAPAIGHWEVFEGAEDAPLVVNLSAGGQVPVTAHYQEVP